MPGALIVGAGIGGLSTALALARQGREVTLVERRTGFTEVGAGIQLSPNASRILFGLGLGAPLRRAASEPERIVIRTIGTGRVIGTVALAPFMGERFGSPYLVIHRVDLQTILLDAVRAQPNVRLLMGRMALGVEPAADQACLRVETAGGAQEVLRGDLVVGADGVWSSMRRALGDRREPAYRGFVAWRAAVPRRDAPAQLAGQETGLWLGRTGHVVHYPIARGQFVNIVAVQRRAKPVDGWSAPGDPAELAQAFAHAAPLLRELLCTPRQWLLRPLLDLPTRSMAEGRMALVGDAAHPVLPFLAQGGALAIEDAASLAGCLARHADDVAAALQHYARMRTDRARRVQEAARRNGRFYHAAGPLALARDLVIGRLGPKAMAERYAWLYGWTVPTTD